MSEFDFEANDVVRIIIEVLIGAFILWVLRLIYVHLIKEEPESDSFIKNLDRAKRKEHKDIILGLIVLAVLFAFHWWRKS